MNEAKLAELEARVEAATPGTWEVGGFHDDKIYASEFGTAIAYDVTDEADASLIANAPTDISDLCAALREAWAERDRAYAMAKDNRERRIDAEDAQMVAEKKLDKLAQEASEETAENVRLTIENDVLTRRVEALEDEVAKLSEGDE